MEELKGEVRICEMALSNTRSHTAEIEAANRQLEEKVTKQAQQIRELRSDPALSSSYQYAGKEQPDGSRFFGSRSASSVPTTRAPARACP